MAGVTSFPAFPSAESAAVAQSRILHLVHSEFERRKRSNPAYSLRAFARALGLQPSGLSEILNGKRGITRRTGARFLARLAPEDGSGATLFAELRNRNDRSPATLSALPPPVFSTVDRERFRLLAEWHHFAILSLADTDDFRGSAPWIAKRLGISTAKARSALERLLEADLLRKDSRGKVRPTGNQFATGTDRADLAIQRSHYDALERAAEGLGSIDVADRDFSLINLAISADRIPEAKAMLRAFRRRFSDTLEKKGDRREVFRLSMQFFPLTEIRRRGVLKKSGEPS